jgi:hypothetical protein
MKKITIDRVVDSRTLDADHNVWPTSVSEKSVLTQSGTEAPNIRSNGRNTQLR